MVFSVTEKDVDFALVNRLGSLHRNSMDRLTDRLNITLVVDWAVKPQHKNNTPKTKQNKTKTRSFYLIKQRIYDAYSQTWYADINNSNRLITYARYKHEFVCEKKKKKKNLRFYYRKEIQSKKISNDQELIQSDPTSCPQNQKGNN